MIWNIASALPPFSLKQMLPTWYYLVQLKQLSPLQLTFALPTCGIAVLSQKPKKEAAGVRKITQTKCFEARTTWRDVSDAYWEDKENGAILFNRPFAPSRHVVQNHTCWWASCAVGFPKQCNSYQSTWTCLCFGSPTAQLSHQHVWFCTMWLDRAKGLFFLYD